MQLQLNGKDVCFKIDTGAEVSAISTDVYEAIGQPNLQILCGPDKSSWLCYSSINSQADTVSTLSSNTSAIGTSLLCFLSFQLFFLAILFKLTYYSQNYSSGLCQILLEILFM